MTASTQTAARSGAIAMDHERVPIPGLIVHGLTAHVDVRGSLIETFSRSWGVQAMHQWTAMTLEECVIRGPSVHLRHTDAVVTVMGEMQLGLRDLRESSPVFRRPFRLTLSARDPKLVFIPPGVLHAFYAPSERTVVMVGNSHDYDPEDDIKGRWQDAALDLDASVIGSQDVRARALEDLIATLRSLT